MSLTVKTKGVDFVQRETPLEHLQRRTVTPAAASDRWRASLDLGALNSKVCSSDVQVNPTHLSTTTVMVRTKPLTVVIKLGVVFSLTLWITRDGILTIMCLRRDVGTSSIVHETTHQPLLSTLSSIVETVVRLRAAGHKVVLVSSGAIGVGLQRMSMPARPRSLSGKQVRFPSDCS